MSEKGLGVWQDTTSYRRGEREVGAPPRCWRLQLGGTRDLAIAVHRHVHYPKNVWLLTCPDLNLDCIELKNRDPREAQQEALHYVVNLLEEDLRLVRSALSQR